MWVRTPLPALAPDTRTDGLGRDSGPAPAYDPTSDRWYPSAAVASAGSGTVHGTSVTGLSWCPFRYNPSREMLIVVRRGVIVIGTDDDVQPSPLPPVSVEALGSLDDLVLSRVRNKTPALPPPAPSPGIVSPPSWALGADPPIGVEYVVITGAAFREAVLPLVRWKASRGNNAGVATVEAILARYSAGDGAASVREYLKDAYQSGLQWVVLAGDETVVPIRYAYAGYQSAPSSPYNLHICDLYFAELDGNWDADGDGLYGEYFGDNAELYAELFVGRLPFSDQVEATTIIEKIIAYERGPSEGAYLTRALSVSADQMRDWNGGEGQHAILGRSMPGGWTYDQGTMIEAPSGESPSPVGPDPSLLPEIIADGVGWVNYLVHGRVDGAIVRAPGYTNIPQSYVWTFGQSGDGHGHFNEMPPHDRPGIHLSIGCDHGGFDMDTPPFAPGYRESVAERLLFTPGGGAVAFVGQSRWGWVATSYKLIQRFYDLLSDPGVPNHLGVYQYLAKIAYPQYRDLNYGNNLYGDPETPAWKNTPKGWQVMAPVTFGGFDDVWAIEVSDAGSPVGGALATVVIGDSVWVIGTTDVTGKVSAVLNLPPAWDAVLTVWKEGYRTYLDTVPQSIITDVTVDDDQSGQHKLAGPQVMVYPNPFNPATQINIRLTRSGAVRLDVFDVLGRRVRTLLDRECEPGAIEIAFDGSDDRGRPLASGMYFARLVTHERQLTRAMVLLR